MRLEDVRDRMRAIREQEGKEMFVDDLTPQGSFLMEHDLHLDFVRWAANGKVGSIFNVIRIAKAILGNRAKKGG